MSEEEKRAINNMKLFARVHQDMTIVTAEEMDIVLQLVERLQKENKELKRLIAHKSEYTKKLEEDLFENCSNYVVPIQKVKDKIEEIKKIYDDIPDNEGNFAKAILIKERQVLQELLENNKE